MYKAFRYSFLFLCFFSFTISYAQLGGQGGGLGKMMQQTTASDPGKPREYELGGIQVTGAKYLDADLLLAVTNLTVGQKVFLPGDPSIARAIRALWKQDLFSNVDIRIDKFIEDKVFLTIYVEERPRLSAFKIRNVKTSEAKEIKNKLSLVTNKVVTDATIKEAIVRIKKFYTDKGYGRVQVTAEERADTGAQQGDCHFHR